MSLLQKLNTLISPLFPIETGVFSDTAPDKYVVLTPLADNFELHADNTPIIDNEEVRISLFDKGNYLKTKNTLVQILLSEDITITDRRYIGHEDDTGYHHFAIDVADYKELEE